LNKVTAKGIIGNTSRLIQYSFSANLKRHPANINIARRRKQNRRAG